MAKTTSARWFDEKKGDVHVTLASVFRTVRDECEWMIDADEYHAGLYCSSDAPGIRGISRRGYEYGPAVLPYNVCRAATDTLLSKISTQRPMPQALTQKGTWKNQKRARKFTQFLEGEFYRQRFFEKIAPKFIRDALVFGRGVLKIWADGDSIRTERRLPAQVFTDPWERDEPRNIYDLRSLDRGVALERFARTESGGWKSSIKEAIESAGRLDVNTRVGLDEAQMTVDRVDILEAWHLPSAKDAGDGRHVVICEGATLVDEEWEHDYFPFVILHYNDSLTEFWGHGLVEQVEGYQYSINVAAEKVDEQYRMSGVGIIVSDGSHIHDQQIRNGITIMRKKAGGEPPTVFQMDLVNEHMRQRPRELTQDALNDTGLSQMSVQSQKPSGITAAIALQTLDDVETQRFMTFGRAWEAACLEVARRYIDCAKYIAEAYGDMAVSVPMKGGLLDLKWNDVYVDGVEVRIFPASLLPQQLGARLEKLKDLWNTGLIDRSTFLRQLDAPDMQAELDLETADKLAIDEMIEFMCEADEDETTEEEAFKPPSAYTEIEWGAKRAQQKLNSGTVNGMLEFNQQLLRRFIKESDQEIQKMKAAAAPPPGPSALGGPMPGPGAPPPPTAVAPELPGLGIPAPMAGAA